jgi:transposase InsO family protein
VTRFQFVADHQERFGVKRLCQIIGVARSSFYYWRATEPARAARDAADAVLATEITAVHTASDGTYGAPRITAELRDAGVPVNHKRVARVMRRHGIAGLRLRRRTRTTIADPAAPKASDLIGRDFTAEAPNQRYVGDITYLPVGDRGFLYLATVLDLCSRRLVGWAIAEHMRTDLVLEALEAAQRTRGSLAGAVLHTDYAEVFVKPRNRRWVGQLPVSARFLGLTIRVHRRLYRASSVSSARGCAAGSPTVGVAALTAARIMSMVANA